MGLNLNQDMGYTLQISFELLDSNYDGLIQSTLWISAGLLDCSRTETFILFSLNNWADCLEKYSFSLIIIPVCCDCEPCLV